MLKEGYAIIKFPIPEALKALVLIEDWQEIDKLLLKLNSPDGEIFKIMNAYTHIEHIEQMISVRDAHDEWQEDGIWHDDGSRKIAYSLSLTLNPDKVKGGHLGLRQKGEDIHINIPTPDFGHAIVFLTGIHGYEHKIHKVSSGKRIIAVGWCL